MSNVNKAIIIGRLGVDPELRQTQSGSAVCNLRIATSENWTDQSGEKQERTEWHRVTVFGRQAENCKEYLEKGRLVYVEGRIQTRKWEDKEGNDRYTTEIVAHSVQFLGGRNDNTGGGGQSYDSSYDQTPKSSGGGSKSSSKSGGGNDFNQSFDDDDIPF